MKKLLLPIAMTVVAMQAVAAEPITDQPKGTLYETVQGSTELTYLVYNGMLATTKTDVGYRTEIVIDGNDFYVHNILHYYENGESWIKGTLNTDNVVEFAFPQTVYSVPENNLEISVNMLEAKIEDGVTSYVITSGENSLRMKWDGNTLTQIKPGTGGDRDGFFGLTHEEGGFVGYGALGLELEIVETPAVALPGGIRFLNDEYSCTYTDKFGDNIKSLMNIYRSEGSDEVYISGLNSTDPKQLVKGVVDTEGNIEIQSAQFMGLTFAEGLDNFVYCYAATPVGQSYEWADKVVLVNDNGVYKADKSILVNLGNKYPLLGLSLTDLTMTSMDDIVRTPAAPYLFENEPDTRFEYDADEGMIGGGFGFDCLSTDGEPLDPENVFFNVYFDGELQTTTIDGEPCTDIPNTVEMTDDMLFVNTFTGYYCVFGFEPVKKVSIQAIYHNRNGEITKSDMLVAIVDGYSDGVGSIDAESNVVRVEYFTMQGVAIAEPAGLCIVRTTYSDGTVKTKKAVFNK